MFLFGLVSILTLSGLISAGRDQGGLSPPAEVVRRSVVRIPLARILALPQAQAQDQSRLILTPHFSCALERLREADVN